IQRLGLAFYHRTKGGQLLTRLLADPDQAKTMVSHALISAIQNGTLVLVYAAIMVSLSWKLSLIALALAPAIALLLRPVLRRIRDRIRVVLEQRGEMASVMVETIEGARQVKAHGAERYERRRFEERLEGYFRETMGSQRFAILAHPISETLGAVVLSVLLVVGAAGAASGQGLRPEMFVAFLALTLRLLPPVTALSQFPRIAEQALVAAERVFEILDLPPDDVDPPAAPPFP